MKSYNFDELKKALPIGKIIMLIDASDNDVLEDYFLRKEKVIRHENKPEQIISVLLDAPKDCEELTLTCSTTLTYETMEWGINFYESDSRLRYSFKYMN